LYCDSPIKDFGEISEREKVVHVFQVKNVTNGDVNVRRILTSCGCITPSKRNILIKVGQEVGIPVEFNAMGYGGKNLKKDILLLLDESKKPDLILSIKARIKGIPPEERISIVPPEKHILNDIGKIHQIIIRGPSDKDIEMSIKGPNWLSVKLSKPEKHQARRLNEWNLELSVNRKLMNRIEDEIVITTTLPLFERLSIPIYVQPKPKINVSPPVLFVKVRERDKAYTEELQVILLEDLPKKQKEQGKPTESPLSAEVSTQPWDNRRVLDKTTKVSVQVSPSNKCIKIKPTKTFPDDRMTKYTISIINCEPGVHKLRINFKGVCVRNVPVVISELPTGKTDINN
jgi:hypothetical protein